MTTTLPHLRMGLYYSILQIILSLVLIPTSFFTSNAYSGYHNLALGIFLLITGLLGSFFSTKRDEHKLIADAWLIISITTAFLSIDISSFFASEYQPLGLASASLLTLVWVSLLYVAYTRRVSIVRI
ncbi:MAG: hypothetical protein QXQ39_05455 [Conexivisphaerales archaeon]